MGTKDQMNREDTGLKTIFELESISGKPILEIKKAISDEKLLHSLRGPILPWLRKMFLSLIREKNYPFIRGQQHTTHLLFLNNILIWNYLAHIQKWVPRVDDKQKMTENSDRLYRQQCYVQFLVDDSFMIPTRSTVHEHVNIEWTTDINVGSEVTPIDKVEQSSYNVPKKIRKVYYLGAY